MTKEAEIALARILFVDDEQSILNSLKRITRELNAECVFVTSGDEALKLAQLEPFDVVVSDMRMPSMDGTQLLGRIAELYPECIRIVLSGYSEQDLIMGAINKGRIWGFVDKPWDDRQLITTLKHAIDTQQLVAERALLRRTLERYEKEYKEGFSGFIGRSLSMQWVYNAIERAAPSNASVFITGPSGTGKELAAQAIHEYSNRKDAPFIALNCAAIPGDLIESEIFGHVKGAFSSAVSNREGAATLAHKGTLFLDELTEMDIGLQAKLLRFIQTGAFQRVGSSKTELVDIRFVCACNRSPLEAIDNKLLREDLYYRLNVISIDMPALNDRGGDVILLAEHFLKNFSELENKTFAGFSSDAISMLEKHAWPGNVRQLENCIHSVVIMCEGPLITAEMLSRPLGVQNRISDSEKLKINTESDSIKEDSATSHDINTAANLVLDSDSLIRPLSEIERDAIQRAVNSFDGNVVKAAGALEVSPSTLYRKIQQWESSSG